MEELRKKTIAALTKQVELLSKDGASPGNIHTAASAITSLTALLSILQEV